MRSRRGALARGTKNGKRETRARRGGGGPHPLLVRIGRPAMGSLFEILAAGEDEGWLRAAAEEALAEVERLDAQWSRFLPSSEISRLNARLTDRVEPRLFALLERAREIWRATDGAFDPALGMRWVRLDRGRIQFLQEGVTLDLGAIGKGRALDRAAEILRARGVERALLHGGRSTALAIGAWPVGVLDPRDGRRLGRVHLEDRSLSASSGFGKIVDGRAHILDPEKGEPPNGVVAAWAIAANATDADALSTAFFVMGPARTRRFVEENAGVAGMVQTEGGLLPFGFDMEEESAGEARASAISRRAFLASVPVALAATRSAFASRSKSGDLRVALVGAGEQGSLLLSQLRLLPGVEVRAVCDTHEPHLERAAGRDLEAYDDWRELLAEEPLEAVVVATPTHLHAEACVAALEEGLHVFCEAPLAHTVEAARAVARAAREEDRILWVGHQRRTSRLYRHVREHVESGAIGKVLQIRAQRHRKWSWRRAVEEESLNWRLRRATSGGLLLEFGSHALDFAQWFLGATPLRVSGLGALGLWKDGRDVDDHVEALFEFPDGALVSYSASLANSHRDEFELLLGTHAAILFEGQRKALLFKEADAVAFGWEAYAKKALLGRERGIVLDVDATKYEGPAAGEEIGPDAGKADFYAELEAFVAAVREDGAVHCDGEAGARAAIAAIVANEAIEKRATLAFTKEHFEV